ncbi:MAG TPA: hypothetical protein ENK34_00830 [Rhodobacteraceae bacterium]|nr:hypothetical protein [Paracoccaceae bacterium]
MPFAPADSARADSHLSGPVAEIVTFRVVNGTTNEQFIAAARQTEPFVTAAPGFISRTLTQGEDGVWTDFILWRDMASAKQMATAFMDEPSVMPFMQAIDPETVVMRHEVVMWQMQQ